MVKAADITGQRFTYLTAVERIGSRKSGAAVWRLRCDCGRETAAHVGELRAAKRTSCGCKHRRLKHGLHNTRLHRIWSSMKARCQNPKKPAFKDYGGRGITVCTEWQEFRAFRDWALAHGYSDELQIDRQNNDGGYSPENCRWVTPAVNHANRRKPRFSTHKFTLGQIEDVLIASGVDPEPILALLKARKSECGR